VESWGGPLEALAPGGPIREDLADRFATDIPGVIFPVDEEVVMSISSGRLPLGFHSFGAACRSIGDGHRRLEEDGSESFGGVSSIEEVAKEGAGNVDKVGTVAVLIPVS
jgi:hypothetical protein